MGPGPDTRPSRSPSPQASIELGGARPVGALALNVRELGELSGPGRCAGCYSETEQWVSREEIVMMKAMSRTPHHIEAELELLEGLDDVEVDVDVDVV